MITDTRPIALAAALTKIPSKVLARRLSSIFGRHPILHTQHGFIRGGSPHHNINALLDACERAVADGGSAYSLFIDFKGAFDAIRHDDIGPALRRLRAPEAYIKWVESWLDGLTACIRFGTAASVVFAILRGALQGHPESPLWYIAVLDTLCARLKVSIPPHLRLRRLPREQQSPRATDVNDPALATTSNAFADDLTISTATREELQRSANVTVQWCADHDGSVSAQKTTARGVVTLRDGTVVDALEEATALRQAGMPPAILELGGDAAKWDSCDNTAHLGVTISLAAGGAGAATLNSVTSRLRHLCTNITAQKYHVSAAIYAINTFVIPKIEYRLRFVIASCASVRKMNARVVRAVCERVGIHGRAVKAEALAAITGTILPEHALHASRIADAFVRLNGPDTADTIVARRELTATLDLTAAEYKSLYPFERMAAVRASMTLLGWQCHRAANPAIANHAAITMSVNRRREFAQAQSMALHALASVGDKERKHRVAYTDGSASSDVNDRVCAFAVLFDGDWLDAAVITMAAMSETELAARRYLFKHAPMVSGRIDAAHADGSYGAELRAILEAVWRAPRGCHLTIRSDSKSAVDAVNKWRHADDIGRERIRMPCRPLLRAIHNAILAHCKTVMTSASNHANDSHDAKRGGAAVEAVPGICPTVTLEWMRAHTGDATVEALGNRIVDCEAKHNRTTTGPQYQLDLSSCERWAAITERSAHGDRVVTGDIRRAAVRRLRDMAAAAWNDSASQARYASAAAGAREHWRFLAGDGRPREGNQSYRVEARADSRTCALFLRLITDSLQFHTPSGHGSERWCCDAPECKAAAAATHGVADGSAFVELTTAHLFECTAPAVVAARLEASQRAHRIHREYHAHDAASADAKRVQEGQEGQVDEKNYDNDDYASWWHRLTGSDVGDGAVTHSTIAMAIGAFTAHNARAAMSTTHWRVDKEKRHEAVAALRKMAAMATQRMWAATAATRRLKPVTMSLEASAAIARGDYRPEDPKRDNDDSASHYRRERKDDDGNDDGSDDDFECALSMLDPPPADSDGGEVQASLRRQCLHGGTCNSANIDRFRTKVPGPSSASHGHSNEPGMEKNQSPVATEWRSEDCVPTPAILPWSTLAAVAPSARHGEASQRMAGHHERAFATGWRNDSWLCNDGPRIGISCCDTALWPAAGTGMDGNEVTRQQRGAATRPRGRYRLRRSADKPHPQSPIGRWRTRTTPLTRLAAIVAVVAAAIAAGHCSDTNYPNAHAVTMMGIAWMDRNGGTRERTQPWRYASSAPPTARGGWSLTRTRTRRHGRRVSFAYAARGR